MEAASQIRRLLANKMESIHQKCLRLLEAGDAAWPHQPVPASGLRHLSRTVGISTHRTVNLWVCPKSEAAKSRPPASFSGLLMKKMRKPEKEFPGWSKVPGTPASQAQFLVQQCASPRDAVRILARLDTMELWLNARLYGMQRAKENTTHAQERWTEMLNARLGILELQEGTGTVVHCSP